MRNPLVLLRKAFQDAAARRRNEHLSRTFDALANRVEAGLQATDSIDACQFQSAAMNGIIAKAMIHPHTEFDQNRQLLALPLKDMQREIDVLVKLASMSSFSDEFHTWVKDRQTVLARRLAREHSYYSMQNLWDGLDENGKLSFLRFVVHIQNDIFSSDTIPFRPSTIRETRQEGTLALFQIHSHDQDYTTTISINRNLLKKSRLADALTATVHEGIHSVLRQMGTLCMLGKIPQDHAFYNDALLMKHRIETGSYISSLFGPGYYADVEEKLCHEIHEGFMALYNEQIDQRRMNTTRIPRP